MGEAASYSVARVGGVSIVTVPDTNDYYYWFLDGIFQGRTSDPSFAFMLVDGDEAQVYCEATDDADWDYVAGAPTAYSARRSVWWVATVSDDLDYYLVQYATGASTPAEEDWTTLARVWNDRGRWTYTVETDRLTDLTWTWFRVLPVDLAGNQGTAVGVPRKEYVVRAPDSPSVAITFDDDTQRVTIT